MSGSPRGEAPRSDNGDFVLDEPDDPHSNHRGRRRRRTDDWYQLARQGYRVTVIEKNDVVGGLGRTFHYGDFHFDVGPHRFHTENPRVAKFIRDILQEEAIEIPRKSGARMFNRFHEWPLRPSILMAMPIALMFKGARDLFFKEKLPGESFEADVVNKYGRTLYDIFFEPYTRSSCSTRRRSSIATGPARASTAPSSTSGPTRIICGAC